MSFLKDKSLVDQGYNHDKEEVMAQRLDDWYGQENFVRGNKGKVAKVIGHFIPLLKSQGLQVITVGGTNGKGETAHGIELLLREKGLKTALWSSPHILSLRERFIFSGKMISYELLDSHLKRGQKLCREQDHHLSYYEFLFFVFCRLVLEHQVDFLILEVGLGGRLDAVNFLVPDFTCVTSLSRDHQKVLGHKLSTILREKLGITRPRIPLVTAFELEFLRGKASRFCKDKGTPTIDLFQRGYLKEEDSYSYRNQLMAFLLCQVVLEGRDFPVGLPKVSSLRELVGKKVFDPLKGRFEKWGSEGKKITFVGAHNIDGLRKLTHSIKESSFDEVILSFSKRSKKDILDGLLHLASYPCVYKKIIVTTFDHEKAWMIGEGERDEVERSERISFVDDWKEYWLHHLRGTNILVTGSYYFIGEVQKYLLSRY